MTEHPLSRMGAGGEGAPLAGGASSSRVVTGLVPVISTGQTLRLSDRDGRVKPAKTR